MIRTNLVDYMEQLKKQFDILVEWKVYLNESDYIHEFYYGDSLIYQYSINENETILKIDDSLKFRINNYMNFVIKLDNPIEFRLGSEKDNFIRNLFVDNLVKYEINNIIRRTAIRE